MEQSVAELLEQEEKRVLEKQQANNRHVDLPHDHRDPHPRESKEQNRYSAEREENDARRSRKSRDLEDEDMKDGSDANGSVRSRRRSRSPAPAVRNARDYRDRRDDRDRGRFYRGRRSSDDERYYRPGPHNGDYPPRDRDRDRDRSRDRDRDRDRDRRRDDRPRGYERRDQHRRRPSPPQGKKAKTPEPSDNDSDRRTVFVQQLAARLRTRDLKDFFEQVGEVVDAQIVKDRVSGRSKGVGYVEFREEASVEKAIELTGQKLLGIPIIAQLTEAEKNRQARNTEGTATQSNGIPFHRLYVGNIHFSITEEDLKNVFEPFGELEFVQLQKEDQQGRSKGYGFVQFIDPAQAKEALEKMNGFELAGRPIRVGLGNDKFTPESTSSLLQRFASQAQQAQQGSSFSGMGGRGSHAGGTGNFDRASGKDQDKVGGGSALDDTDVAGVNFSNYSRDSLMRKLARTDEPEPKIAPKTQQQKAAPVEQAPSRCILLKNVYNQAEESDPNWQKDLEDDVRAECNEKYGQVVHIGLALDNNDGEIYIKFDRVEGGQNAVRGLNGRFYGSRMITAQYVVDHIYNTSFPKAAKV